MYRGLPETIFVSFHPSLSLSVRLSACMTVSWNPRHRKAVTGCKHSISHMYGLDLGESRALAKSTVSGDTPVKPLNAWHCVCYRNSSQ